MIQRRPLRILRCATVIPAALAAALALCLLAGSAISKDVTVQGRTELGTIPEFHPELGLGALQGHLDPKALPNSLEASRFRADFA